ncbi:phosphotransferase family protein [Oceanicoccus sp. KOV_DT_Chl]|uniref:phosphotransferase family protein n=1 Tax=Oceanicoccus sp. KOV_DT_Chl TaxID=1904639 RepID=UPI000C7C5689|nr:phosphotransferase family protein [Oceanicoccus sp. KOV_DT_Chl]
MSNVTLMFEIHYQQDGIEVEQACVGRLCPEIEKPVFPEYDLSEQYKVMEILDSKTSLPTPPLLGLELDTRVLGTPFYIMKKIEGRIPGDMPPYTMGGWMMEEVGPAERAALWNAAIRSMAQLHQLDYQALGFDFLAPAAGKTALQAQLDYWQRYLEWGLEGTPCPICDQALQWLNDNQPKNEPTTLCWGDARLGNLIISQDCQSIAAVLDWEMAVLGNPVQDLAWWNFIDRTFSEGLGMPRLEGLPSVQDTNKLWEQASGFSAKDYHYYEVFAGLRYGLIMARLMVAQGQFDQVANNFVVTLLAKVMAE